MSTGSDRFQLYAEEFSEADRAELVSLDCGPEPWARAATEWISGQDVLISTERGTRVWLYRNESGVVVGFGSLGTTRRRWPPPDGTFSNLILIPMLGIDHHFQGQPSRENKYSHQIMGDLRYRAIELLKAHESRSRETLPLLSLYVHMDNIRAVALYKRFGFEIETASTRGDIQLMTQRLPSRFDPPA